MCSVQRAVCSCCAVQVSAVHTHTHTVLSRVGWLVAAGVLAMVPATTLKRMLGRSVGWVFEAEYAAVLGVNALEWVVP